MNVGHDHDVILQTRHLYRNSSPTLRTIQGLRPYICPFDSLVDWIPEQGTMLDVGCGAGLFLGLVGTMRPGIRGVGFDASRTAIAAAQGMAAANFPDGRIRFQHSAVEEPWPAGLYDVVSMIDVMHHVAPAEHQTAILNCYDKVAPGGLFLYKDMATSPAICAGWNRFHDIVMARQWIHYRAIGDVEQWLTAKGAQKVERSDKRLWLYMHELLVVRKPHLI